MAQHEEVDILVVETEYNERASVVRELRSTIRDARIVAVRGVAEALGFLFGRGAWAEPRAGAAPQLIIAGNGEPATLTGVVLESAGYRISYAQRPVASSPGKSGRQPSLAPRECLPPPPSIDVAVDTPPRRFSPAALSSVNEVRPPDENASAELVETIRALFDAKRLLKEHQQAMQCLREEHDELKQIQTWTLLKNRCLNAALSCTESNDGDSLPPAAGKGFAKAFAELAGTVCAELSQPLIVIAGRIQLLKYEGADPVKRAESLAVIETHARQMAESLRRIGSALATESPAVPPLETYLPPSTFATSLPWIYRAITPERHLFVKRPRSESADDIPGAMEQLP